MLDDSLNAIPFLILDVFRVILRRWLNVMLLVDFPQDFVEYGNHFSREIDELVIELLIK